MALDAIDKALDDADALILSYGIPATVQTTLLARLASTVALYYLQGAERMTDDIRKAYEGVVGTLKAHSRGELIRLVAPTIDLLPAADTADNRAAIGSAYRTTVLAEASEDAVLLLSEIDAAVQTVTTQYVRIAPNADIAVEPGEVLVPGNIVWA